MDKYRGKFFSVIIQPKINSDFWLSSPNDDKINAALMKSCFPLFTEIKYVLSVLKIETVNGKTTIPISKFAVGSETSVKTHIPHYQIYLEFRYLVRLTKIYQQLNLFLTNRVHIVIQKVYNSNYMDYCLKPTSNFEFNSNYYWNIKFTNGTLLKDKLLINLRPKLREIKKNYLKGQALLLKIVNSTPDDRTGIWLCDIIGGTGKTAFFQTIIDDTIANGMYLRVSEGVERLSAKLRKKIKNRLETKKGYPKFIWINFGRTVEESSLKAFADFAEQILDGMLDDNFGNTAQEDFVGLPYVNLIVTANTPPNLKHLTGDRLKLLTLFPVHEYNENKILELKESLLIPIYIEIKVRILKSFQNNLDYKFAVRLQTDNFIETTFSKFSWFNELLENVNSFKKLMSSRPYKISERLETKWISTTPYQLQSDIFQVYQKALFHSSTVKGKNASQTFIEASSFPNSRCKVYLYNEIDKAKPNQNIESLDFFYPINGLT